MKLLLSFLAAVVALSSAQVSAKVVSFPADNFSIDAPAGWGSVPLPPLPKECRVVTAARNETTGNVYVIMTTDLPSSGAPNSFLTGMMKPLTDKGWKASPIRDETIDGKPFAVFSMSREDGVPFMLMATTFIDKRAYVVQTVAPKGNVEQTPELNAVVQSFHFLQPVQSINRHEFSNPFNSSYQLGRFAGFVVIAIVVILLIKKVAQSSR
jgi:hypothetical protein